MPPQVSQLLIGSVGETSALDGWTPAQGSVTLIRDLSFCVLVDVAAPWQWNELENG
jgi:hypothetical protein